MDRRMTVWRVLLHLVAHAGSGFSHGLFSNALGVVVFHGSNTITRCQAPNDLTNTNTTLFYSAAAMGSSRRTIYLYPWRASWQGVVVTPK